MCRKINFFRYAPPCHSLLWARHGKIPAGNFKKCPRGSFPRESSKKILLRIFVQNLRKDFRGIRYQRTRTAGAHTILLIIILYHFIQKSFFLGSTNRAHPAPPLENCEKFVRGFPAKILGNPLGNFPTWENPRGEFLKTLQDSLAFWIFRLSGQLQLA